MQKFMRLSFKERFFPEKASQQSALNLAAGSLGQFIPENHDAGVFVGRGALLYVALDFFLEFLAAFLALHQHDAGLDHLAADGVRRGADAALQHVGQLHDDAFDLERPDAVAGGLIRSSTRPTYQK